MENTDFPIIAAVHEAFLQKGLRLAVAESCTGGLISHMLTSVAGASGFFETSLVCYSRYAKRVFLDIPDDFLSSHGLISVETAMKMAGSVRKKSGADLGLATTGNLGPSALEGEDVGLVYVAVSSDEETISRELRLKGSRAEVKSAASVSALEILLECVKRLK